MATHAELSHTVLMQYRRAIAHSLF